MTELLFNWSRRRKLLPKLLSYHLTSLPQDAETYVCSQACAHTHTHTHTPIWCWFRTTFIDKAHLTTTDSEQILETHFSQAGTCWCIETAFKGDLNSTCYRKEHVYESSSFWPIAGTNEGLIRQQFTTSWWILLIVWGPCEGRSMTPLYCSVTVVSMWRQHVSPWEFFQGNELHFTQKNPPPTPYFFFMWGQRTATEEMMWVKSSRLPPGGWLQYW